MATNLYAGLLNDTGGFRFDNTLPFTFEFARRLAERGVDTAAVAAGTLHRYRRRGRGHAAAGAGHVHVPRRRPRDRGPGHLRDARRDRRLP